METQELLDVIRNSITAFTSLKPEQINLDSDMSGQLALDSADRVELVIDLEEKLKISIHKMNIAGVKQLRI